MSSRQAGLRVETMPPMSEYETLREEIEAASKQIGSYHSFVTHHLLEQSRQIDKLWEDNAELRDELHAVANRLETLTRAFMVDAAEVAEKMIATNSTQSLTPQTIRVVKPYDHETDAS